MRINKTIKTVYSIELDSDEINDAILAYIHSEEGIDLSEATDVVIGTVSYRGVTVDATTEESE